MRIDDKGRENLFAFLRAHGYAGTPAAWWDEVSRQTYLSSLRLFASLRVSSLHSRYPKAQRFILSLLARCESRFDSAYSDTGGSHLLLGCKVDRPNSAQGGPLKLSGLAVDIEEQEGYVEVRIRCYVAGDVRRDRYLAFLEENTHSV